MRKGPSTKKNPQDGGGGVGGSFVVVRKTSFRVTDFGDSSGGEEVEETKRGMKNGERGFGPEFFAFFGEGGKGVSEIWTVR